MVTKQGNTLANESTAPYDMSDIFQQADEWFKQGFEYWKTCGSIASSYAGPQTWLETTGVSKTMEKYLKGWARIYGLGRDTDLEVELAVHKRQAEIADATLQKIKKEKTTLKRTLTMKEKKLKAQRTDLDQYEKRLREKDKEIQTLQANVKMQAKRLIDLEAARHKVTKPAAPSKTSATVPKARK